MEFTLKKKIIVLPIFLSLFASLGACELATTTAKDGLQGDPTSDPSDDNQTPGKHEVWVSVGSGYGHRIVTSFDGFKTIEKDDQPYVAGTPEALDALPLIRGMTYGKNLFILVGGSTQNFVRWSADGINWSDKINLGRGWLGDVAYGNGIFVSAGGGCDARQRSVDGKNWTKIGWKPEWNAPGDTGCMTVRKIGFGGGRFVTTGDKGSLSTTDGVTWKLLSGRVNGTIVYGKGNFLSKNEDVLMRLRDGSDTWQAVTTLPPQFTTLDGVAFLDDTYYVNSSGTMYMSKDLMSWTSAPTDQRSGDFFVVYDESGNAGFATQRCSWSGEWEHSILASTDALHWDLSQTVKGRSCMSDVVSGKVIVNEEQDGE